MTTKKREDIASSREEAMIIARRLQHGHIDQGDSVGSINERKDSNSVYFMVNQESVKTFNVTIKIIPPKPEFEKGTIGLDQDSGICFFKELNSISDYIVCSYRTSLNETGGYTTSNFTPIYQADPIEKRAYELACKELQSTNWKCFPVVSIKEYILSKAKEELSK